MATATSSPAPTIRRELAGPLQAYAYELTQVASNGVTMRVEEGTHDAAVFLTPQDIVELRADLATMYLRIAPPIAAPIVGTPAGREVAEFVRRAFVALVELDKVSPHDVDDIYRAVVQHVRSARPYILREVG